MATRLGVIQGVPRGWEVTAYDWNGNPMLFEVCVDRAEATRIADKLFERGDVAAVKGEPQKGAM